MHGAAYYANVSITMIKTTKAQKQQENNPDKMLCTPPLPKVNPDLTTQMCL
jgi:hypothetical protein